MEDTPTNTLQLQMPTFTSNERDYYTRQQNKCKFKSPEEEYIWAQSQPKSCSKCLVEKKICDFNVNTSSSDGFNKVGERLRRGECNECTKLVGRGKSQAKKMAKDMGISYIPPEGTVCANCNKLPSPGNGLVFDHCHEMNIFRGYLCNSCNRSIGVLGDNVDGLIQALNYLNKTKKVKIVQKEDGTIVIL